MTAFTLKIIASLCMLIDHTGAVFPESTPEYFRWIGRIAFPIFAYMVAQGCKHTRNINKYLLRLGIFAIVSEIPFDIALMHYYGVDGALNLNINFLSHTNVFYTLFLGVACIAAYEKFKQKMPAWLAISAALPFILAAFVLQSDYSVFGVGLILLLYIANPESKVARTVILAVGVIYLYRFNLMLMLFALVSAALVFLYNGRQGPKVKWAFYVFYPAHISVLAVIWLLFPL